MILTDTHTHLYSEQFDEDRRTVIQKAIDAGIERFFIPAIDKSYYKSMFDLKRDFPDHIFLMSGLHPTHVKEDYLEELEVVRKNIETGSFCGIGEIGIDLYWDKSYLVQQQDAFRKQIQWAKELNLPIAIHCREAFEPIFEILEEEQDKKLFGIFHCFTGNKEQAERAIRLNMKLGIGGVVTFKNGKIDQFIKHIPLDHIVLETDSPYLAPAPYRGKRNESIYLLKVAEKLSEIYGLDIEELAKITTENSRQIFKV
ncbi:TatD family hydrolase [Namhaeicola litoreus]|uniref:TatD family hydrolase n=1 Tax=Namhaeicola litoreus TaxID=1052145 RepID=A0ABW3Y4D6_9FLAO